MTPIPLQPFLLCPGQSQCLALFAAPPPEASAKGGVIPLFPIPTPSPVNSTLSKYDNKCPPELGGTLLHKVELTGEGVGIGRIRGERVITPPLALASGGGAANRAKHWLCPGHKRKGCEGVGVMMKDIK
ncbi:hypothetical protein BS47DRAFT_1366001 [Hydnum rufescens UP504]|uniref:Uncharacterized protein n=1 Tax=Hydnum rufescens UP504 TaxID=1448309 RepID=A0A9P6AM86_9AGAM|nr:hypothetical protein BS47DRAFT_1366001 [Hydnum rufescens UP504]